MLNGSIWPIDRALSGATARNQSGPGSDERVHQITPKHQVWRLTIRRFWDICKIHVGGRSYPFAEMQSVYSTASEDWAIKDWEESAYSNSLTKNLSFVHVECKTFEKLKEN